MRDGQLERLPKPGKNVEPLGLAVAPDGSAWYTDIAAQAVSRMTPAGEVSSFRLDTPMVRLGRLAVAPDGAAWFAEASSHSITRLKDGELTRHAFQIPARRPLRRGGGRGRHGVGDAAGGQSAAAHRARTGRSRPSTCRDRRRCRPTSRSAPDGAVWFIQFRGNSIGRLKDGKFAEFAVAKENAGLTGLAVADDGAVWFGMLRAGSLGRLRDGEVKTFKLPRDERGRTAWPSIATATSGTPTSAATSACCRPRYARQ